MAQYAFRILMTVFALAALLAILLFKICGRKTVMYLVSLGLVVLVISSFMLPLIMRGYDPVMITLAASVPIVILVVYCAEGFTPLANLSIVVTIFSFVITALLTGLAIYFSRFTGLVSDVATTVGGIVGVDLQKLLSAGIMLSALGAIIEMSITQVATVMRFASMNPRIDKKQISRHANDVGVAHLGAIISTLFLLYAGVSLPLLIVFAGAGMSIGNLFGYEPFSSEVVRMLTGMIGLVIAMPVSTATVVWWVKRKPIALEPAVTDKRPH
jgi:uncharacterized membrane protein